MHVALPGYHMVDDLLIKGSCILFGRHIFGNPLKGSFSTVLVGTNNTSIDSKLGFNTETVYEHC